MNFSTREPNAETVTETGGKPFTIEIQSVEDSEAARLKAEEQAKTDEQAALDAKAAEEAEAARLEQEEADKAAEEAQRLADEEAARVAQQAALDEQREKDRLAAIPVPAPVEGSVFKIQAGVNFSVDSPGGTVSPL